MKTLFILGLFLMCSVSAHSESRSIGVRLTSDANSRIHVAISSAVEAEKKKDVTVEQAAALLREAKSWGSSVEVGVVAHDIPLREYLPLLKAIADNPLLELNFLEGRKADFISDNIRKTIEQKDKPGDERPF